MKTLFCLVLTSFIIMSLSSCSRDDYGFYTAGLNKTNMSEYRSFALLPPDRVNAVNQNEAADNKIKDATVVSLNSKGLKLEIRNPDLLVTYTANVGKGAKTVYSSTYYGTGHSSGWGYGYGWGYSPYYYRGYGAPYVYYGGATATGKEHYKEGTIIIDLIDTRTHKIVWRGYGVGEMKDDPKKTLKDLPRVVDGIIAQLQLNPPGKS